MADTFTMMLWCRHTISADKPSVWHSKKKQILLAVIDFLAPAGFLRTSETFLEILKTYTINFSQVSVSLVAIWNIEFCILS